MKIWKFITASLCIHVSVAAGVAGFRLSDGGLRHDDARQHITFVDLESIPTIPPAPSKHILAAKSLFRPKQDVGAVTPDHAPPGDVRPAPEKSGTASQRLLTDDLARLGGEEAEWEGVAMGVVRIEFANEPGKRIIMADASTAELKAYLLREDTPWVAALADEIKNTVFTRVVILIKIDENGSAMDLYPDRLIYSQ